MSCRDASEFEGNRNQARRLDGFVDDKTPTAAAALCGDSDGALGFLAADHERLGMHTREHI